VPEGRADTLFGPTDDNHQGPVMVTRFQQRGHRIALEPMIGPLHLTEGICYMLTFSIEILATKPSRWRGGGVIGVVNDVNDMQWHIQSTCEFTAEDQCGPAGWVAVVSDN
jgi:hypothetical protein